MGSALDSEKTRYLVVNKDGILTAPPQSEVAAVDCMSRSAAEAFARRMARYREADHSEAIIDDEAAANGKDLSLSELLAIEDLDTFDPETFWQKRRWDPRLHVPLGTLYRDGRPTGTAYIQDLGSGNYSGGKGVHGALQGQSGSGKSIVLENFVLSTCAWHPPDKVNFLIIDFKGEATFLGFDALPHVRGIVRDIGDPEIIDRSAASLLGEIERRKRLLSAQQKHTGLSLPDIGKYLEFRAMPKYRDVLPPLPILIVLIDEASVFYDENKNEFTKVFTYTVKQGRSVGVWIHMASQELQFLHSQTQLWAEMNVKTSLVVDSVALSRTVIGDESAHDDRVTRRVSNYTKGGHIFYKFPGCDIVHLRSAKNTLEYRKPGTAKAGTGSSAAAELTPFTLANQWDTQPDTVTPGANAATTQVHTESSGLRLERSEISLLLDKLCVPAPTGLHTMWTPPLRKTVTLHELGTFNGLAPAADMGDLVFPLGIVDHPQDHIQSLLSTDFATNSGSVVIAGTAKSGRTTALTTMVVTAARRWAPRLVSWLIVDQGGKLGVIRDLPNVAAYASRGNTELRDRVFAEAQRIFTLRSRLFAVHSLTSTVDYLKWRDTHPQPADPYGYLFVGIDGWLSLQAQLKSEDVSASSGGVLGWLSVLGALIEGGSAFGIHFAITTDNSGSDLPYVAQKSVSPIYLRGADQMIDAGPAAKAIVKQYPETQPGLTVSPATLNGAGKYDVLRARIAVPVLQNIPEPPAEEIKSMTAIDYSADIAAVCEEITRAAAPDQRIPALRPLPTELPFAQMWAQWHRAQVTRPALPGRAQRNIEIPLGQNSVDMTISAIPWSADPMQTSPHTLILGRAQSGRTTALRTVAAAILASFSPHDAKIVTLDERGGFIRDRRAIDREHYLAGHGDREDTQRVLHALLAEAHRRVGADPDLDETAEEHQTFFDGPELFVLVDNAEGYRDGFGSSPQAARLLADLIRIRTRIGIHVIMTATHDSFLADAARSAAVSPIAAMEEVRAHVLALSCGSNRIKIRDHRAENFPVPGRAYLISDAVPLAANGRPPIIQLAQLTRLAPHRAALT